MIGVFCCQVRILEKKNLGRTVFRFPSLSTIKGVVTGRKVPFPVKIYPSIAYALCKNGPVLYNLMQHLEREFAKQLTRIL